MAYTLLHGDCLELLPTLPAGSVDAIITDLPYGTTECKWDSIIPLEPMWQEVKRILKPRGAFITTASQPFTSKLIMSNLAWFKYEWIWEKYQGTGFANAKKQPLRNHENILVFYKHMPTYNPQKIPSNKKDKSSIQTRPVKTENYRTFDKIARYIDDGTRYPTTIMKFYDPNRMNTREKDRNNHPTQKPVSLMEYLIKTYTNSGDTVLDFCMGSGTTIEAAEKTGRNSIGIELDAGYFAIANERLAKLDRMPAQLQLTPLAG